MSGKSNRQDEFSSPSKLGKKNKNVINLITLPTNGYSNYIKNKHINSIIFNICGGNHEKYAGTR